MAKTNTQIVTCDACGDSIQTTDHIADGGHDVTRTVTSIPLRHHEPEAFRMPKEKVFHGCTDCTPISVRDTRKSVTKIAVDDGDVTHLLFSSDHGWVAREEVQENPYITRTIDFIENELIETGD